MNISQYLEILNNRYQSGISREHSYRADLENLIRALVPDIHVTNEPADVTDCGNPDYVLTKGKIPVGYIEAKDVGKDLSAKLYNEQFTRYRDALDNLIITDYLWFRFYDHAELVHEIRIGEIENCKIVPITGNFQKFENLLINFCGFVGTTIKSPKKLAVMMANKARLLQNILENAVTSDEKTQENTSLKGQYETFKEILIHDLTPKGFADIYAQTLAYGMFAARLHDPSLEDFSRQEAAELIPKSNPFLRKLFGYVAGPDIDDRIVTVVDNLAEVFRATNIDKLLKNFGKNTQTQDAIIHFYETFLAEYDPKLRKSRGVWYTPEPVVKFIVRAVDDILKTEFDLPQGLADTSRTTIKVNTDVADKRSATGYKQVEKEVHKVQILDPATGTGTFLAEVVNFIYSSKFEKMQGAWSGYVEEHLIPRLNGFELLMASYAMAHLKLDMLLRDTGYTSNGSTQRLNVYLTNSLEEHHKDTGTLFSNWLSTEANEANHIKRDTPVMCVIGNPPYAVSSTNKGEWIENLTDIYKKGVLGNNKNSLSDDYIKFIRYGQYYIEKNGEGILAYISNNSFLDGITHNKMRKSLLKTFDEIYIVDLHGSVKKKETASDGSSDQNVFDIQQGVSINLFVKKNIDSKAHANVHVMDVLGKRGYKYDLLNENSLSSLDWIKIKPQKPSFFFKEFNYLLEKEYKKMISINELFEESGTGIKFRKDNLLVKHHFSKQSVIELIDDMNNLEDLEILQKYNIKDTKDWKINEKRKLFQGSINETDIKKVQYRLFDNHFTYYPYDKIQEIIVRGDSRKDLMRNLFLDNIALISCKQQSSYDFQHTFISENLIDMCTLSLQSKESTYAFPLYLYPEKSEQQSTKPEPKRKPNLDPKILKQLEKSLGLEFLAEEPGEDEVCFSESKELQSAYKTWFTPLNLLDYIYAVLHSPTYRETYKEFLKIDFPRVPYPDHTEKFWQLVKLGGELRSIHLLESPIIEDFITSYPVGGDNVISRKITKTSPGYEPTVISTEQSDEKSQHYADASTAPRKTQQSVVENQDSHTERSRSVVKTGKVWINDEQYFDNVPEVAWEFYIGGYQPAQKWLKDRKGRKLSFEDILHYQKIIVALTETDRLMKEIDKIEVVKREE